MDWTYRIEEWLEEIKNEYKIYRMIRFNKEEIKIKSFEIPIFYSHYLDYLDKTSKMENFIITHNECYPYGVIDMAARETRILTPPVFLQPCLIRDLEIPEFSNKEEFLNIIRSPIVHSNNIDKCTDYINIAQKIIEDFNHER
jgi:hypothetical protein